MRKLLFTLILLLTAALCACSVISPPTSPTTADETPTAYLPVTAVDRYVLEPDEQASLSDADTAVYRGMMDALLAARPSAEAADSRERTAYLLDLLRRSPYYFFVDSAEITDGEVRFTYAYPEQEQRKMLAFMDESLLSIVNHDALPSDNELDTILKIYHAVTLYEYDHDRTDNKNADSPLLDYPADEVYKTYLTGKGLCYSFAYIFRLALQQRGIDCFVIRGVSGPDRTAHMWDLFVYDGAYFYCDPAWDRARAQYSKLQHFGKTEDERTADAVIPDDFSSYHEAAYGDVLCTDPRFSVFRGMSRFSPAGEHRFLVEDYKGRQSIFHTESFTLNSVE